MEDLVDARAGLRRRTAGHERHRFAVGAAVPLGAAVADEHHLGTVLHDVGGGDLLGPDRARVVAAEILCVAAVHHREVQRRVEPALGPTGVLGVDGEARCEGEAALLGHLAQHVEVGPRALGVDVVGGDGGDPAPVVDAGVEQHPEVVAQVGRRLEVDVGGQHEPCHRERPQVLVGRAGLRLLHAGAQLGQEVLDDDLLHVPVAGVGGGDRLHRRDPVDAVVADADEDPGRERDLQFAGGLERGEAAGGHLVGCRLVALEVVAHALDHHPLARGHGSEPGEFVEREGPAVGVGEQPGLVEHELGHRRDIVHGRVVAVLAQERAGHLVAVLGPFAQGEQRLVAPLAGTLSGNAQHVVWEQVGLLEPRRWLGERAVATRVVAQHRQRDEHLRRVGDAGAVCGVAHGAGGRHDLLERELDEVGGGGDRSGSHAAGQMTVRSSA